MYKSYCAVEKAICPVCGESHDVGVLLHKRLQEVFTETSITTHLELCKEHKEKLEEGFVALVGIDEDGSTVSVENTVQMEDAYRTGKYALIKEYLYTEIFKMPVPKKRLVFCDDGVFDLLEKLQSTGEATEC